MRNMLAKKREFELKKGNRLSEHKGNMLESKVREEYHKFTNSQLLSAAGKDSN